MIASTGLSKIGHMTSAWRGYALCAAAGVVLCGIGLALCAGPTLPPGIRGSVESIVYAPAAFPIMVVCFALKAIGGVREVVALVVWGIIGASVCQLARRRRSIRERFARRPVGRTVEAVSLLIVAVLVAGTALVMARGLSIVPTRLTLSGVEDATGIEFPVGTKLVVSNLDCGIGVGKLTAKLAVSRRDEGVILKQLNRLDARGADAAPSGRLPRLPASFEFRASGGSVVVRVSRSGPGTDAVDVRRTWQ